MKNVARAGKHFGREGVHESDANKTNKPAMRDGTEMDFNALRAEAEQALEASGHTQSDVADALDVHRSAVSRALKTSGGKFQELQRRIIEHLTPYQIERRVSFKAHRKR